MRTGDEPTGTGSTDSLHTMGAFAVIRDDLGRILLSHRRDMDLWNLPGGRIERGELPTDAVVREVKEETEVDVGIMRLTGVYSRSDENPDLVFTFECRIIRGSPRPTSEADIHDWFPFNAIPINTSPKQVARIRDVLDGFAAPVFRTLDVPSGRDWLQKLKDTRGKRPSWADLFGGPH